VGDKTDRPRNEGKGFIWSYLERLASQTQYNLVLSNHLHPNAPVLSLSQLDHFIGAHNHGIQARIGSMALKCSFKTFSRDGRCPEMARFRWGSEREI
jgi:hypothetical protein